MKMYILVKDDVQGFARIAAHAISAGYLKCQDKPVINEWQPVPLYKAVCEVNAREFANAKLFDDHVV
jgi:hypothetical protein